MPNSIDDRVDMELERESMGTATQFEQAIVETTGDRSQTIRGKSSGTEGQGDANFVDLANETEKKEARKEIVPRSSMWDHFIKIKDEKGRLKSAKCKYCQRILKADSNQHGTSSLNKHFNVCKRNPNKFDKDPKQGTLQATGGELVWSAIKTCIRELFKEYRNIYAPIEESTDETDSTQVKGAPGGKLKQVIAKKMKLTNSSNNTTKSELDKYLSEDCEDTEKKIDVLIWWKDNAHRLPVLAHMAQDILAIPISTVASESVFSTSGRILDDFRTSLTPFMLEALVCTQDWLRRSTPINIQENIEELTIIEKGIFHHFLCILSF
jgi:hypothetical protein